MSSSRVNAAKIFKTLTKSDTAMLDYYRALYAVSDGNIVVDDAQDNQETFPVTAGQILPIQPKRLKLATTAVVIGLN